MNAGHFWHDKLDFDEMNINCQCIKCNHFLSGNLGEYATRLIDKHGLEKFNELGTRRFQVLYRREDLEKIVEKYKSVDNLC